jgi:hypothetical protein
LYNIMQRVWSTYLDSFSRDSVTVIDDSLVRKI